MQRDVNVVVVDWSAGGNTWNYYKAAINTKIVGYQISKYVILTRQQNHKFDRCLKNVFDQYLDDLKINILN